MHCDNYHGLIANGGAVPATGAPPWTESPPTTLLVLTASAHRNFVALIRSNVYDIKKGLRKMFDKVRIPVCMGLL